MTILSEILKTIDSSDFDTRMKQLCDQIMDEEIKHFTHPEAIPHGPNIFLAIEIFYKNELTFLCIEREMKERYFISVWGRNTRSNVIDIPSSDTSSIEKILTFFAHELKFYKGEL